MKTEKFFNEKGKQGKADAFFSVESRKYTAILIAEKRWRTPAGRSRSKRVCFSFSGSTARELAATLRENGWRPPRGLRRMCEASRHA